MAFFDRLRFWLAAFAAGLALSATASAQSWNPANARRPLANGLSVWAEAGAAFPSEGSASNTLGINFGGDYFITRAVSAGLTGGYWRASLDGGGHGSEGYLDAVGTYNWELGVFHPFVQGGLGLYRVQFDIPGSPDTYKGGFFGGGGADVFFNHQMAVEMALRYHYVPDAGVASARFFEAMAGLRYYF